MQCSVTLLVIYRFTFLFVTLIYSENLLQLLSKGAYSFVYLVTSFYTFS